MKKLLLTLILATCGIVAYAQGGSVTPIPPGGSGSGGGSFPAGPNQVVGNTPASTPQALPTVFYDTPNTRLSVGARTDFNNAVYLLSSFGGLDAAPYTKLLISVSSDGVNWQTISSNFVGPGGATVLRDPTIWKVGTRYWVSYTSDGCGLGLGMAYSDDLMHWNASSCLTITGTNPMVAYTWAPEAFIRNPGCTGATGTDLNGNACTAAEAFYLTYGSSADGNQLHHSIYAVKALDRTMTSWGNDAGTANSADLVLASNNTTFGPIDSDVVQKGTSYYMWVTNSNIGCTANTGTNSDCNLQLYSSSTSPVSGYTLQSAGGSSPWAGSFGTAFGGVEGSFMYYAGNNPTTGNPIWRMVSDHYPVNPPKGFNQNGLTYIESQDAGSTWTNWQSAGLAGNNYQVKLVPGNTIVGGIAGVFRHGSVYRAQDVATLRDVVNALALVSTQFIGPNGGTLVPGAVLSVPTPTATGQAVNKGYVDNKNLTLQHTFAGAGSFNFNHNLSSLYPLVTCYNTGGSALSPSGYTIASTDANNTAVAVTGAADLTCNFAWSQPTYLGLQDTWPMNENTGTTFFSTTGTNNCTFASGAGTWGTVAGMGTASFSFNGTGSATCANDTLENPSGATGFSVSFWMKWLNGSWGFNRIVGNLGATGWLLQTDNNGGVQMFMQPSAGGSISQVWDAANLNGAVHSIVFVYTGPLASGTAQVYVDGTLQGGTKALASATGNISSASPIVISGSTFVGPIGYIHYYNQSLTAGQAAAINSAGPVQ